MTQGNNRGGRGGTAGNVGDLIEVGRIVKPQGVNGELRVLHFTSHPEDLSFYRTFVICNENNHTETYRVQHCRVIAGSFILKLKGIEDRSGADQLRNHSLFVSREQLPDLERGEYFISDLIGVEVITDEGERLGVLTDVLELSPHDVYQIQEGDQELLIPAVSEVILEVKLEERRMTVRLLEGLRD